MIVFFSALSFSGTARLSTCSHVDERPRIRVCICDLVAFMWRTRKARRKGARCLACVARDPRTIESLRRAEANRTDAARTTCATCGEAFGSRSKLFRHLDASEACKRE